MATGQHIGRVLLAPSCSAAFHHSARWRLRGDRRLLRSWLSDCAVARETRSGLRTRPRSQEPDAETQQLFRNSSSKELRLSLERCDVSRRSCADRSNRYDPPVFLCAVSFMRPECSMMAACRNRRPSRLYGRLAPKVAGAWNLHRLSRFREPRLFCPLFFRCQSFRLPGAVQSCCRQRLARRAGPLSPRVPRLNRFSVNWGAWSGDRSRGAAQRRRTQANASAWTLSRRTKGFRILERLLEATARRLSFPVWTGQDGLP